jgi:endonuclease/exonuclease/phosphatase (EEP) superfamily protein YafD
MPPSLEEDELHASNAPPPPVPATNRVSRLFWASLWFADGVLAGFALLRLFWHDGAWLLLVGNAFTPFLYLPAYLALIASLASRRWGLNILSVAIVVLHLVWVGPELGTRSPPPHEGERLHYVTSNLYYDNGEKDALIDEILSHTSDILCLQEVTPAWREALAAGGVLDRYPHGEIIVREDAFGMALLSPEPLDAIEQIELGGVPQLVATRKLNGRPLRILCTHIPPPAGPGWMEGYEEGSAGAVAWAREQQGSFVMLGDFNATPYSRAHDQLEDVATDAWRESRGGLGATAPNGRGIYLPVRIDRIWLSADLAPTDVILGTGAGSDHKPLAGGIAARIPEI